MKTKTTYICRECGYKTPKWLGKCPGCNEWNTIEETLVAADTRSVAAASSIGGASLVGGVKSPQKIGDIKPGFESGAKRE